MNNAALINARRERSDNIRQFVYQLSFLNVAVGANATAQLTTQSGWDFDWKIGMFVAYNHASLTAITQATQIIPVATVMIQDQTRGTNLMSAPVPISALFGNGALPFILPDPYYVPANTTLSFTVYNGDSTLGYDIYLSLVGSNIKGY